MAVYWVLGVLFIFCTISAHNHGNSARSPSALVADVDSYGRYQLSMGGRVWLASGPTFMTLKGKVYSTADGSLILERATMEKGVDVLGAWQATSFHYHPAGGTTFPIVATLSTYTDQPFITLTQSFPLGVPSEGAGEADDVSTGFPTFDLHATNMSLGYHAYGGIMFGNTNMRTGRWGGNLTHPLPVSGLDSGPLILFKEAGPDALVLSSFRGVMGGSAVYTVGRASWGLLGRAWHVPAGFTYGVIVYHSPSGINKAVAGWGDVLRKYYSRPTTYRDSDFSNNYLGYYTDNGAYYYYKTEPNKTYDETLYGIKSYADSVNIPYRYVQYDSWWYYKGPADGVTEWVSMDSVFPHGMRAVWNKTGWTSVAHNRWWSDKTKYAKQNGGKYDFIVEPKVHKALPTDPIFWDDLMRTSRQWGLITYEQDWLNVQFDQMDATVTDVELGSRWLLQMGRAAADNGLTIQYCMAPSRHALQSLQVPVVSQARVTTDYHLSPDQWRIGVSSLFAAAMGVAPFKDNFWTTTTQPGNPYNKTEPHPALQAVVATLSTGPVTPSDRIGYSNASLIMRSCDISGRLLKPSRPALAIDDQIRMAAAGRPLGEVWATYTTVSGMTFGIILAADLQTTYDLVPTNAGFSPELVPSVVFPYDDHMSVSDFSDTHPLHLTSRCGLSDFCLYHTTPRLTWQGQELLLIGEISKWVPMSPQRVRSVSVGTADVVVVLEGVAKERINFHMLYGGVEVVISCIFGNDGWATFSLSNKTCR